jgi:hypothetical protein
MSGQSGSLGVRFVTNVTHVGNNLVGCAIGVLFKFDFTNVSLKIQPNNVYIMDHF